MTFEDRRVAVRAVVEAAKRRVAVLAGCMATGLREVLQHAKIARALGADAAVVTPPFYFRFEPAEIVSFFSTVAKAAPLPVVAYNIPSSTHVSMSIGTILKLSEIKGIIGLKDSSADIAPLSEILQGLSGRKDFAVMQGHERVIAASILMGANGGVLGLANIHPRLCVDLCEAAARQNVDRAFALQAKLNDLFNIFRVMDPSLTSVSTVIGGMKAPLEILGLCSRRLFPPAVAATAPQMKRMKEILRRAGLKLPK
jgi:4-hydroxy-tetrahydrodipicolinate synthase